MIQIEQWCLDIGDIEIRYLFKFPKVVPTAIDETNPYWMAFKSTLVDDLYVLYQNNVE